MWNVGVNPKGTCGAGFNPPKVGKTLGHGVELNTLVFGVAKGAVLVGDQLVGWLSELIAAATFDQPFVVGFTKPGVTGVVL